MSRSIQNHVMVLRFTQNKSQNLFSGLQITHHPPIPLPLFFSSSFSLLQPHWLPTGQAHSCQGPCTSSSICPPCSFPVIAGLTPHLPVFLRCHLCNETDLDHTKAFENHHPRTLQILLSFFFQSTYQHLLYCVI